MTPADVATMTRGSALQKITALFAVAGLETPDLDARLLLAHALGVDRLQLLTDRGAPISPAAADNICDAVRRRLDHEPMSRIAGERWFYGRPFRVTSTTLDPRPESETLVDVALALARELAVAPSDLRLLDIGTGTGCLLLTLLSELPGAQGWATDISAPALDVARANLSALLDRMSPAERQGDTLRRVEFHMGAGFAPLGGKTFDMVISNPPYIPTSVIPTLDAEVRHHDPMLALDGGADGLDVYRQIAAAAPAHVPQGWIILEVGNGQAQQVANLLRSAYAPVELEVRLFDDLAGVQRCVAARPRQIA